MLKIAIQNPHKIMNASNSGLHDYAIELIRSGVVRYIYITDVFSRSLLIALRNKMRRLKGGFDFKWSSVTFILNPRTLNSQCDVLLNFNTYTKDEDFGIGIKRFDGLKMWHVGDYFWNEPGSLINGRFEKYGVDYIFGYASHDLYCDYFRSTFKKYDGRVVAVPFGYGGRFRKIREFSDRENVALGLGSVNPLRPLDSEVSNYIESANYYPDECWLHKERRYFVLNESRFKGVADLLFPKFPKYKDFAYDIVEKLNSYKMFFACESIFNFQPAKYFEGIACGAVLLASSHPCNAEFGFLDGRNAIFYDRSNVDSLIDKIGYYNGNAALLDEVAKLAHEHSRKFSHQAIANYVDCQIQSIAAKGKLLRSYFA